LIAVHNKKSLIFGIPGLILLYGGLFLAVDAFLIGVIAMFLGAILLFVGVTFYVKAKARNPAWVLLIFIPILGLLALVLLIDKSKSIISRRT